MLSLVSRGIFPDTVPEVSKMTSKSVDPDVLQGELNRTASQVSQRIEDVFINGISDIQGVAIAITGSEARNEKIGALAELEVMVLLKEVHNDVLSKIKQIVEENSIFLPDIEVKSLKDPQERLICFNRQRELGLPRDLRPFPSRGLDATFVAGDQDVFKKYKHKFYKELQKGEDSPSFIRKFRDSALKAEVRLLRQNLAGKGDHFDPARGVFYFDRERRKGPKYPMLRVVQYSLVDYVSKLVSLNKISEKQFQDLPKDTIGRLDFLVQNQLLSVPAPTLAKVKKSYAISLIWSAEGQDEQKKNPGQSVIEVTVPQKEIVKAGKRILNFAELLSKQSLQKLSNLKN